MGLSVFDVLDKAVEAGGENLSAAAIAGKGNPATDLLVEMCKDDQKLLVAVPQKKGVKYSLTTEGRKRWEKEATAERKKEIERQMAIAFLRLIQKKEAPPAKDLQPYSEEFRQEIQGRGWVGTETKGKKTVYRILDDGKKLLADEQLNQQIAPLRAEAGAIVAKWKVAQGKLLEEVGATGRVAEVATTRLDELSGEIARTFERTLAELTAFAGLMEVGQRLRLEIEASHKQVVTEVATANKRTLEALEEQRKQVEELRAIARREAEESRRELATFEERLAARFAELVARAGETRPQETPKPAEKPIPPPVEPQGPSEDAVWAATRAAYERLRQEHLRIGGIVKIPELTDKVRHEIQGLSPDAFHELLQKWQRDDRLTLQLCNDPRLERRASDGIHSPRGLLFYLVLRS